MTQPPPPPPAGPKRTIAGTYFRRFMVISSLTLILLGAAWLGTSQWLYTREVAASRQRLLAEKVQLIEARAREAVAFINFTNNNIQHRIRIEIRQRVEEAHAVATGLYERLGPKASIPAIKTALRSMRYNDGSGYFFATSLDGISQVSPPRPDWEGTDISQQVDSQGVHFIQTAIRIARTTGRGYYEYQFQKLDDPGNPHHKISYAMHFEPLDWFIGTGLYVEDVTKIVQQEVLEWLGTRGYVDGGYIFAGTYEGIPVLGPFKGREVLDTKDVNGKPIVRELIAAAKAGGGMVDYVLPSFGGRPAYPKISYSIGVEDWKWYVGSGIPTDAIEKELARLRQDHLDSQMRVILGILATLALGLIAQTAAMRRASRRIGQDFASFKAFFDRAGAERRSIDRDALHLEEFDKLAEAANAMVEERHTMESALRDSENRYRGIFENIVDGYYRADMDGNLLLASPSAMLLAGWKHDQDISKINIARDLYVVPDDREGFMKRILREGRVDGFTTVLKRPDGEQVHVEVNARLLRDEKTGQPMAVEGIMRDISERKRTQELLIQTEKMMSVGGLAAGMAHEINNPLGGILQGVQNIGRRISPELPANVEAARERGFELEAMLGYLHDRKIMRMLDGIRESGERAAQIVRGMLNFSRATESSCAPCDLNALADHAVELASSDYDLSRKYDFRKVRIVRDYAQNIPPVPCSVTEIEQVLLNLLRNSAQAMATAETPVNDPCIVIRTRHHGDSAIIELGDNGPGMDEATRKRVFEPFFTTKPPGVGTGLGLSVSYFIITQNHGGEFSVTSVPGHGTTFNIRLPLDRPTQSGSFADDKQS